MLQRTILGNAIVDVEDESARLLLPPTAEGEVALAQLDDHHPVDPGQPSFTHRPPLRVSLYARASPGGSCGFGFWNDPFSGAGELPARPGSRCVWFCREGVEGEWRAGIWDAGERRTTASPAPGPTGWRRYDIEWLAEAALFRVDGREQFRAAVAVPGPLGFAIWISNRVLTVSPEANTHLALRKIDSEQWLEVKSAKIERLA